ncbi:carboxymuconolactone decarboxylase, partial [bacterium]|nr:carboxymuconolactone decarboxylase [bacterium]
NKGENMPHIPFNSDLPGILGPMSTYPQYAIILNQLTEALLRKNSPNLSQVYREIIASFVSYENECVFCSESHGAVAEAYLNQKGFIALIWKNYQTAPISDLLKAFLNIAKKTQAKAKAVDKSDIERAIQLGASNEDIHDVVLISAAFCMFNRYVDALDCTTPPRKHEIYLDIGHKLSSHGYRGTIVSES